LFLTSLSAICQLYGGGFKGGGEWGLILNFHFHLYPKNLEFGICLAKSNIRSTITSIQITNLIYTVNFNISSSYFMKKK
jgi:hypothetical protein